MFPFKKYIFFHRGTPDTQKIASLPTTALEIGFMLKISKRFSLEYRRATINDRIGLSLLP